MAESSTKFFEPTKLQKETITRLLPSLSCFDEEVRLQGSESFQSESVLRIIFEECD